MPRFCDAKQRVDKYGVDFKVNVVFNLSMTDAELIDSLGGPAKVAALLGLVKAGGTQRVHNWKERGIPASVKLSRPDLFLPHLSAAKRKATA